MKNTIAIALMILVTGCATVRHGTDFDPTLAKNFVVGQTTMDQAKAALGEPQQVMRNPEGRTKMVWRYSEGKAGPFIGVKGAGKMLGVVFDEQGRFLRISDEAKSQTNP
jgi:hypothetical protein